MEIHGSDIIVDNPNKVKSTISNIIKIIRIWWPDLVVEIDDISKDGVFVYENNDAQEAWREQGWTELNDKTMIHIIWDENRMTFVIDDYKENLFIIEAIKKVITNGQN